MLPLFYVPALPKEKVYYVVKDHESHITLPPVRSTSTGK